MRDGTVSVTHASIRHHFIKNGTGNEVQFWVGKTRGKKTLASPIFESLLEIPLAWVRMHRWRELGKKAKYKAMVSELGAMAIEDLGEGRSESSLKVIEKAWDFRERKI